MRQGSTDGFFQTIFLQNNGIYQNLCYTVFMKDYEHILAAWRKKNIISDAHLAEALNGQGVSFAYHSCRIENAQVTFHDTREIFDHDGVTGYTGDLKTLFEIRNAKAAYECFLDAFGLRRPIDETFIKELHFLLTQNTYDTRRWQLGERPGEYKKHDYVIGKWDIGAAPEDVPEEMAELQDVDDKNLLTAAAYFHAKFENIHAFADGNGRVGRLAMNYFLVLHNHPPITIHEEDRRDYFEALEKWDEAQELKPLTEYLCEQLIKTWRKRSE